MLNEFNVLQFSTDPVTWRTDPFANGTDRTLKASGLQALRMGWSLAFSITLTFVTATSLAEMLTARVRALHRRFAILRSQDFRVSLTEFGVVANGSPWDWTRAARIMDDLYKIRLWYTAGNRTVFWQLRALTTDSFGLVDATLAIHTSRRSIPGIAERVRMQIPETTIGSDGSIEFNGYYGDLNVLTIDSQPFSFTLTKGVTDYVIAALPDASDRPAPFTPWKPRRSVSSAAKPQAISSDEPRSGDGILACGF